MRTVKLIVNGQQEEHLIPLGGDAIVVFHDGIAYLKEIRPDQVLVPDDDISHYIYHPVDSARTRERTPEEIKNALLAEFDAANEKRRVANTLRAEAKDKLIAIGIDPDEKPLPDDAPIVILDTPAPPGAEIPTRPLQEEATPAAAPVTAPAKSGVGFLKIG